MTDLVIEDGKQEQTKAARAPRQAKADAAAGSKAGWQWIVIPKTEKEVRDVYVNPNFQPTLIKRGVPVQVPPGVIGALDNARETRYFKEVDPVTGKEQMVPQEVLSYPYQTVAAPAGA
jgi:hypothetical protein